MSDTPTLKSFNDELCCRLHFYIQYFWIALISSYFGLYFFFSFLQICFNVTLIRNYGVIIDNFTWERERRLSYEKDVRKANDQRNCAKCHSASLWVINMYHNLSRNGLHVKKRIWSSMLFLAVWEESLFVLTHIKTFKALFTLQRFFCFVYI